MKDQFLEGRLYVGDLNHDTTKEDIQREFGKYGRLVDVWMARSPPGFAFVEYESLAEAETALRELNGRTLLGSRIKVEPSRAQNGRGGRGGGGRGGGRGGGGRRDGGRPPSGGGGGRYGAPRSPRGSYRDYPSDYGRGSGGGYASGDYGRGGGYRDDSRGSRYNDSYSYGETAYRSRSPVRRRSPGFGGPPTGPRGRDYGGRDYGGGRDVGGRDYVRREQRRDYDREPRDYPVGPPPSYSSGRMERSQYDRGPDRGYDRNFDHGYDRPRRSPPRR
ncbi:uncharacterized protein [Diadema antillarum]|uniref:uncharacterized protein n=1 Tax=Diadema antillarum TaxID=105358 RepID=UPI003A8BC6FF